MSSGYFAFFTVCPAKGHPLRERCVKKEPFICPVPSQPGVGQLTPSNFIAVAAATAALCCSMEPPDSNTLALFLLAIGHPEALESEYFVSLENKLATNKRINLKRG